MLYVGIYLVAIVAANLIVGWLGPKSSPFIAFFLIGLDLSLRDKLHELWHGNKLVLKMGAVIVAGGVLSYLINRNIASIALGSSIAFAGAMLADGLVYESLFHRRKILKMNASNIVSAAVDTVLFIWIAFGVFLWKIMILQYLAKVLGGLAWSYVLVKIEERSNVAN
jgi:hypothetical protein